MRKILYLLLAAVCVGFVGCDNSKEAGWMGDPDARVNAAITGYQKAMTEAPNGWKLIVSTKGGGGMQYWVSFTDANRATMYTDFFEQEGAQTAATAQESSYRILALQRPTLCFDTYTYIHVAADPDGEVNGGANGKGLLADFEFEIVSFEGGKFTLCGRQNKCDAYMVEATAAEKTLVEAGKLMATQKDVAQTIAALPLPSVVIEENLMVFSMPSARRIEITYRTDNGAIKTDMANCIVNLDRSITLLGSVTVLNTKIEKIAFDGTTGYSLVDTKGTSIPIEPTEITTDLTKVWPYPNVEAFVIMPEFAENSEYFIDIFDAVRNDLMSATGGYDMFQIQMQLGKVAGIPTAVLTCVFDTDGSGPGRKFGSTYYPLLKNADGSYSFGRLPTEYQTDFDPRDDALLIDIFSPLMEEYFGKYKFMIEATAEDPNLPGINIAKMTPVGKPEWAVVGACI